MGNAPQRPVIRFAKVIRTRDRGIEPRIVLVLLATVAANMSACASVPPPSSRVSTAQDTVHDARAVGAATDPEAAAYLQSAERAIAASKERLEQRDNEKAAWFAARGQADANLSLSLAHAAQTKRATTDASRDIRNRTEQPCPTGTSPADERARFERRTP